MVEQSKWIKIVKANPDHSNNYIQRFLSLEADGKDLNGEARFIDAMLQRGAHILDAGCGPGRVGAALEKIGHTVVGVDVDPALITAAAARHQGPHWINCDLAELDLAAHGIHDSFDAIVCGGNVMTFVATSTRATILGNLRKHLAPEGRIVIGFGAGRDYDFDDFFEDVTSAGLVAELKLATWDLRPFMASSDFLVAVLIPA